MPDYFDVDDDTGQIAEKYPDSAFLQAVDELEPASTSEVAGAVGCTRRNADIRLRKLADAGKVKNKKIGNSLSWMTGE